MHGLTLAEVCLAPPGHSTQVRSHGDCAAPSEESFPSWFSPSLAGRGKGVGNPQTGVLPYSTRAEVLGKIILYPQTKCVSFYGEQDQHLLPRTHW